MSNKNNNVESVELNKKYDFKAIEKSVTDLWNKNEEDIIIKSISYDPNKELFSWLEGPPTANAPPGLHHVEVRVFKDLFCRFKYMQGYTVPRKGGWDCHGLPVEVQVEKKLGLKTKKDVMKYGEDKFISECKKDVFTFVKDWSRVTKKLAFWVDLEKPYMTLNTNFMESVWWSLKELFNKQLLYKGHKVVPYCPRCETPLSSHEVAQGYKDVTEESVTVRFKLKNENKYILAWTTTPWTLVSNLALAVNPKVDYVEFESDGNSYIMAKELVSKYFKEFKIKSEFKGKKLEGKQYEPVFSYIEKDVSKLCKEEKKDAFKVICANYVTTEDGTGVVHQAPAFGEDDYQECKKNNIVFFNAVEKDGTYNSLIKPYKGRFVKDCDKDIIKQLEDEKKLIKAQDYTHSYPFCWRCKTPLLYYAMESWFVKVADHSDRLVKNNESISWHPNHIKDGRFGNWIAGAKDWAVSRNKFWGTPLPIWICENSECNHQHAIGSIEELHKLTDKKVDDLHKPVVDKLTFKCEKCGSIMKRTPEVIDCWYDSGSAPFAQYHYPFENKEMFEKSSPYSFISEAIDQTRGWFYTMHVLSTLLFDKNAYSSCAVGGLLCDENGEKMSKSKGNIVKPEEIFDEVGVDTVRMLMCSYPLGEQIKFGKTPIDENIKPFFNTLWNSYYFAHSYMKQFNLDGSKVTDSKLSIEDKWMISKINELVGTTTGHLEEREFNHYVSKIQNFVTDELSRWYIKLIRDRTNEEDKSLAYVFKYVFDKLVRILAPVTPYTAEYIYKEFIYDKKRAISIHLESWPKVDNVNYKLNDAMQLGREFVQGILAARDKAQIGVRWPLDNVNVLLDEENVNEDMLKSAKSALELIKPLIFAQTNIKDVNIIDTFSEQDYSIKPSYREIGSDFGTETGDVLNKIKTLDENKLIKAMVKGDSYDIKINGKEFLLNKKHFDIERHVREPWSDADFKFGTIYISKELSQELLNEGYAREISRRVQDLRKQSGLEKTDKIELYVKPPTDISLELEKHLLELKSKLGAKKIIISTEGPKIKFEFENSSKIKGNEFTIYINKL
jgi:isoleucyl-tRNA synthetase